MIYIIGSNGNNIMCNPTTVCQSQQLHLHTLMRLTMVKSSGKEEKADYEFRSLSGFSYLFSSVFCFVFLLFSIQSLRSLKDIIT